MAKITIKFEMEDGTVLDDVAAQFSDVAVAPMVAAAEKQGYLDSTGMLIKGARAVTYGVRALLTSKVLEYTKQAAAAEAQAIADAAAASFLSSVTVIDNMPPADPVVQPDQPEDPPE